MTRKVLGYLLILLSGIAFGYLLAPNIRVYTEILSAIVLAATGIIIFWYSHETKKLRITSQKQLEELKLQTIISLRPFIRLQWYHQTRDEYGNIIDNWLIRIVNEGRGIALKVRLKFIFKNNECDDVKIYRSIICGEIVTKAVTDAGHEDVMGIKVNSNSEFIERFSPKENEYTVELEYRDIFGNIYQQSFKADAKSNDKYDLKSWSRPKGQIKMEMETEEVKEEI